jgi:hypothetical protein
MAEAIAVVGVVSAGLQCADAAVKLLSLASSLRSKLKDAPDKVKRRLGQIDQLIALAEWMKKTEADLSSSSLRLPLSISISRRSGVSWVEAALLDLTNQARNVQHILEDMVQEAGQGKMQNLWKGILTVKREQEISSALDEIERQKATLALWLGQHNSRPFEELHHDVEDVREGVRKVDQDMLDIGQTFRDEVQSISTQLQHYTTANVSVLETLRSLSTSNADALSRQIQQHHVDIQSESSLMQLQLRDLVSMPQLQKQILVDWLTFKDA